MSSETKRTPSDISKREKIVQEIYSTEKSYINSLGTAIKVYYVPIQTSDKPILRYYCICNPMLILILVKRNRKIYSQFFTQYIK